MLTAVVGGVDYTKMRNCVNRSHNFRILRPHVSVIGQFGRLLNITLHGGAETGHIIVQVSLTLSNINLLSVLFVPTSLGARPAASLLQALKSGTLSLQLSERASAQLLFAVI